MFVAITRADGERVAADVAEGAAAGRGDRRVGGRADERLLERAHRQAAGGQVVTWST